MANATGFQYTKATLRNPVDMVEGFPVKILPVTNKRAN